MSCDFQLLLVGTFLVMEKRKSDYNTRTEQTEDRADGGKSDKR